MDVRLLFSALLKFALGVLLVGALIFCSAGTFLFFGGWLFMGVQFLPMLFLGVVLWIKNPALLKKRLLSKETQKGQRGLVFAGLLMFVLGFVVAGLDFRFKLCPLPRMVSFVAAVFFLSSYGLYACVMRHNAYLFRTVTVVQNQKVVETGPYAVVRHPMYAATVMMFLSVPLVLGSFCALAIFLFYLPVIAARIKREERLLEQELAGYYGYKKKVKYRLLPFIW